MTSLEEYRKAYEIYKRLLLANAKILYPVPARYNVKVITDISEGEVSYDFELVEHRIMHPHQMAGLKIKNLMKDILAVLNGRCNAVGISVDLSKPNPSYTLQIATYEPSYQITKI